MLITCKRLQHEDDKLSDEGVWWLMNIDLESIINKQQNLLDWDQHDWSSMYCFNCKRRQNLVMASHVWTLELQKFKYAQHEKGGVWSTLIF